MAGRQQIESGLELSHALLRATSRLGISGRDPDWAGTEIDRCFTLRMPPWDIFQKSGTYRCCYGPKMSGIL